MRSTKSPAALRGVCRLCAGSPARSYTISASNTQVQQRRLSSASPSSTSRLQHHQATIRRGPARTITTSTRLHRALDTVHHTSSSSTASPKQQQSPPTQPEATQPEEETYYTLFPLTLPLGPPPHGPFPIPARALRTEFLNLQRLSHPDRHATPQAKALAQRRSAFVNEAYRTLLDPLRRAQYLLRLRGVETEGDESAKLGVPSSSLEEAANGDGDGDGMGEAELLMVVMEAHEVLEEARTEEDLAGLRAVNEERIGRSVERLGELFAGDEVLRAKAEAVRLKYWMNIRQGIEGWEPGRGGGSIEH